MPPNPKIKPHVMPGAVPTSVSVDATTTVVVAENTKRGGLIMVNDSDETIYLALGADAVLNKGIRLNAAGGVYEINWTNMTHEAVNAICASGSKNLTVHESTLKSPS